METEKSDNSYYYKYSEKSIKAKNPELWNAVANYNGYEVNFKTKFYMYENSIALIPVCECGNELKFIDMKSGFRRFCSKRCMLNSESVKDKKKSTNLEKYGVDNASKSEATKEKVKKTNLEKFGAEYPLQSDEIKEKSKGVFIERYGVDNPSKLKSVRDKAENTMLEKYGTKHAMQNGEVKESLKSFFMEKYSVDNPSKLKRVREKAENTMLERYGVKHALQDKSLLNKFQDTNLKRYGDRFFTKTDLYGSMLKDSLFEKNSNIVNTDGKTLLKSGKTEYLIKCGSCGNDFTIQRQLWRNRTKGQEEICLVCNPISSNISKEEKNIMSYIRSAYNGEVVENYRLENKEIDIFLPGLKIGFEYNGLYWHSELNKSKGYHYDKMAFFNERDIRIMQIWEDDWKYKSEIVKSMIENRLGKSDKIFARKCEIREVSNKEAKSFLTENHIQGFVGSKIKIGLYHNAELVSLMTFGHLRRALGQRSKDNTYELLRFCNKAGTSVIGGASKLFGHFISRYEFDEIVSYSLNSHSTGNLYRKLNFDFVGETGVNYFWCKGGIRYHRFNFRKDKLVSEGYDKRKTEVEIMRERDYYRLFDCGSKKFIYRK